MRHLFCLAFLFNICFGKIYKKCELAYELKFHHQLPMEDVKKLVCIAQYESSFNTDAVGKLNFDGSLDYGLFQINNRYWCGSTYGSNVCNIECEALLNDHLSDDITCTKRIVKDTKRWLKKPDGYVAWVAYNRHCNNINLDDYIAECAIQLDTPPSTEPSIEDASEIPSQEEEVSTKPPQEKETSTNPPRASGFETPRRPPTKEESSDSGNIPSGISGMSSESDVKETNSDNEVTTDIIAPSVLTESPSVEEVTTIKSPPRASGLGIVIRPSLQTSDSETPEKDNIISLKNIPLRSSGLGENIKVEVPPRIEAPDTDKEAEEEVSDNASLRRVLEEIEKDLAQNRLPNTYDEPQYFDRTPFLDEVNSEHFQEPASNFDHSSRYSLNTPYQDLTSFLQLLQGNNQAPMFESRLPNYDVYHFNPSYQEIVRPELLTTSYQPFEESDETHNPFSVRHPESSEFYIQEFEPKNAFRYLFPISTGHMRNIFKPFSFFNFQKPENNPDTTNAQDSGSGFNFVKPFLVPELDFRPIDINIKKLIKPVKIPIPYPNINIVKETAESVNIKDFIKPISKPQFNFQPVQVGFKRIVKPVLVPTVVKKQIEIPKLALKEVGIPFLKPSLEKTETAERTFTSSDNILIPSDRTFTSSDNTFIPSDRTFTSDNTFIPSDRTYISPDRFYNDYFPYEF